MKLNIKKATLFIPLFCSLLCCGCNDCSAPAKTYSFNEYHPEIGEEVDIDLGNERFIIKHTNIYDRERYQLSYSFNIWYFADTTLLCSSKEKTESAFYCTDVDGNRIIFETEYGTYDYSLKKNDTAVFYLYYKKVPQEVKDYINDDGKGTISLGVLGETYVRLKGAE